MIEEKKELVLSSPITAHGEKLHVLELRQPTYDEITKYGFPFSIGDGEVKPLSSACLEYIPVLAGIPKSSAKKINLFDIFKASMLIVGFFTQSGIQNASEVEGSEEESSTQHTSGK
ncbi:phage tail assembly protein [Pantoea sp. Bo_2]|uniref:Phage tail assembly protein n=1 Tax=Candidatus Pantoea gossypiicola TaxID=2608008 RepID=A0AB34CEW7_9GAMM|nr:MULTISPECIES: phage tail assembly protein [Pantoea]KAA5937607.1 phage tail assembly protein [Pantoea sp. VH_3]KAA5946738.1 phage tail assembly protein [Pantoea sp. VH_25]KAA5949558.1 phage tail assembly protein [Pantoea sp. VH_24]KAA5957694.1 phage tail assembly protein [Pantoea sp. VH_16]KAA5959172.1 phage tail assembly protein [Pantoea sp. VH_18]